ncbi:MAG: hypothetical protein AAFV33_23240 [Chloroflexota bacterium]
MCEYEVRTTDTVFIYLTGCQYEGDYWWSADIQLTEHFGEVERFFVEAIRAQRYGEDWWNNEELLDDQIAMGIYLYNVKYDKAHQNFVMHVDGTKGVYKF